MKGDIERDGGKAMQVVGDVTKFAEIEAVRRQVEQDFGPIDVLIANAGGSFTIPGPLEEVSEEGWHASVDGNDFPFDGLAHSSVQELPDPLGLHFAEMKPTLTVDICFFPRVAIAESYSKNLF